ncbi:efflux RND transporter permease subunit [Paenibacillus chartarius]|uniref:Efflux RND transporter permease subunit n=1 Tax=Paenibacillus chartarius TaxID=747481 RepID=A0ABV6DR40_9BACL
MSRLTDFSMKNVSAVIIIIALLFGGGLYSTSTLKIENFPDISFPVVSVSSTYQASPQDVMEDVTKPLEEAVSNLADVKNVSSTSSGSFSSVIIEFNQGIDLDKKKTEVKDVVAGVSLPAGAGEPQVSTFGSASAPSYYLTIQAKDGVSQAEMDRMYKDVLEDEIEGLNGIDHYDVIGNRDTKIDIELDSNALNRYGLTPAQLAQSIQGALTSGPVGTVKLSGNEKMARITGSLNTVYDLQNMEVTTPSGTVLLSQLASVEAITDATFTARLDEKPAIALVLYKTKSANAVDFSSDIHKLTAKWSETMPQLEFKELYDGAVEVKKSINGMLKEGVVGALLAALMILVFLRNIRMTLIVLVSIPLSILITLLTMSYLNITLNIMTLGGIFIAIGRVVDDSIVVIENIYSRLVQAQEDGESVIRLATKEVSSAITSSTLATVGVFGPIGMVSGIAGQIFRPFAITLACALLASLIVALTVIPMMAKLLVAKQVQAKGAAAHREESYDGPVYGFYRRWLEWSLRNGGKTLLLALLALVVSLAVIVPNLSVSFIPSDDSSRNIYFTVKLPNEYTLEATDAKVKEMEKVLREAKTAEGEALFESIEALVGYEGGNIAAMGVPLEAVSYKAQVHAIVREGESPTQAKKQYTAALTELLPAGSELKPFTLVGDMGSSADFSYKVKGDDQQKLQEAAVILREKLKTYPELTELEDSLSDAKTELKIEVDQKKARLYGLSASSVRDSVAFWLRDSSIGEHKLDNVNYTINVKVREKDVDTADEVGRIAVRSSTGSLVYLSEIARIQEVDAPVNIQREKKRQVLSFTAKIESANKGGISQKIAQDLNQVSLPDGVSREVAGVSQDIGESFSQLFVAMGVAVFVVYLVMVLAFGNASAPFAILFSLPLAAIGGLLGLFITRTTLDVTTLIGFMMLIGIVVTNAIVLIDRAQQLREQGYTVRHALIEAGIVRLRPIIMTAVATIAALVPLALGFSEGTIISKGLSIVVIGGLITSTVLTLVVVPVAYEKIEGMKLRLRSGSSKRKASRASAPSDPNVTA